MHCPECERDLRDGATRCPCGWTAHPARQATTRDWEPSCVRCARPMPGYKCRFGLCQTCIDREQADLRQLAKDLERGTVPIINPKYAPEGRRAERRKLTVRLPETRETDSAPLGDAEVPC